MIVETIQIPDNTSTQVHHYECLEEPQAVIVLLAALGVSINYYRTLAELWAERGYNIALIESRGMKLSSVNDVRRENFGFKEILDYDLETVIPQLQSRHKGLPLWLGGHSLGGQLALLFAAKQSILIDGVFLVASGSNYYGTLPSRLHRIRRRIGFSAVQSVNSLLGYFPGHRLGFGGRQPKNLIKDWTHEGTKGHYRVIGCDKDYEQLVSEFSAPVVMISVKGDRLVPRVCTDYLASKLECSPVKLVEIDSTKHGLEPFNHFNWTKNPTLVIDALCENLSHKKDGL